MINIQKNIPLAPYTTFKIGGPAKFFMEVKNEDEIIEALKHAKKNNLKYFILAGGSNVLVSDKGFNGLVISIQLITHNISGYARSGKARQHEKIKADAGVNLSEIVSESAEVGLSGLEWAAGIPGTVGGAVRGNAGAFGNCIADTVDKVRVIIQDDLPRKAAPRGRQFTIYDLRDCNFSYRNSIFKEKPNIIICSVALKLKKGNPNDVKKKIKEILEKRKEKQPQFPSAGSYFKNPIISDREIIKKFESDTGLKIKDDKIPAGWLIEEAGFKGRKIGGAQVSQKHGNFIINTGGATAEDVIILASIIKQKVRALFNVQLMEEAQLVGF